MANTTQGMLVHSQDGYDGYGKKKARTLVLAVDVKGGVDAISRGVLVPYMQLGPVQ